jgi:osmoprotectant transport system permease protein
VNYLTRHPGEIALMLWQHVTLVGISLAIAFAIALPLGTFVARSRRFGGAVLAVLTTIYTIPSLALLALLVPLLGIGAPTAIVALVAYAQLILVRNVAEGLRGVPNATIDAARGLGMTPRQIYLRVELPQAAPVIVGGLRLATIVLISLATIASWIAAGGMGTIILYGLQHDDPSRAILGSAFAGGLAIGANAFFRAIEVRLRAVS